MTKKLLLSAAAAAVLMVTAPAFAQSGVHNGRIKLYEGRASAYVPQSSSYYGDFVYSPSSREQMIHAN